jgi:hypothetical protein
MSIDMVSSYPLVLRSFAGQLKGCGQHCPVDADGMAARVWEFGSGGERRRGNLSCFFDGGYHAVLLITVTISA